MRYLLYILGIGKSIIKNSLYKKFDIVCTFARVRLKLIKLNKMF